MDSTLKYQIFKAVRSGRSNNILVKHVGELYSLMQIGIKVDLNDLDAMTAEMLLCFAEEIQYKAKLDAKLRGM